MPARKDMRLFGRTRYPGIYKRGNRFIVVIRVGPERRQIKRTARTLGEAQSLRASLLETRDIAFHPSGDTLFRDYALAIIRRYSGRSQRHTIKEHTRVGYERQLERLEFIDAFAGVKLRDVTTERLEDYAASLLENGLSIESVKRNLVPLKIVLGHAARRGHIVRNPARDFRMPPRPPETNLLGGRRGATWLTRTRALDDQQLAALMAALQSSGSSQLRLLVDFLLQTGLRISEALALDVEDVDLNARCVRVAKRIYKGVLDRPKSTYSQRRVPLSHALAKRLRSHCAGRDPNAPLWLNSDGQRLDYDRARRELLKVRRRAALRFPAHAAALGRVGFHSLRHTCASLLIRSRDSGGIGAGPKEVQVWLGHHSAAFTLDTYAELWPEHLPGAEGFDGFLSTPA